MCHLRCTLRTCAFISKKANGSNTIGTWSLSSCHLGVYPTVVGATKLRINPAYKLCRKQMWYTISTRCAAKYMLGVFSWAVVLVKNSTTHVESQSPCRVCVEAIQNVFWFHLETMSNSSPINFDSISKICPSARPFAHPFVRPSIRRPPVRPSVHRSFRQKEPKFKSGPPEVHLTRWLVHEDFQN